MAEATGLTEADLNIAAELEALEGGFEMSRAVKALFVSSLVRCWAMGHIGTFSGLLLSPSGSTVVG